jgi:chemotaxis protein methyltransferase CheR
MTSDSQLLHRAAQLLDLSIGLKPDSSFRPRLDRALRDVAGDNRIDREQLVDELSTNTLLFDALLDRVTVQESGFFRHPEHFEILARSMLPKIKGPLRAWSAACANGQEAYSVAMTMTEVAGGGSVLASDVSPAALRRTIAGTYADREMTGVSADRRALHFDAIADGWQAKSHLRRMVTVQRHNLLGPIPPQVAACHVVMCRNVLIYFKQHHAKAFLDRLADAMHRDAYLFVGAAETIWQMTERFEPVQMGVSYAYRPVRAGPVRATVVADRRVATPKPTPIRTVARPIVIETIEATDQPVQAFGDRGRQLLAAGSTQQAIVAFRQWAYMAPDDPTAHFQLGSALDAADARPSAVRAYRAALAALDRCTPEMLTDALHGFNGDELRHLLLDRCIDAGELPQSTVRS